MYTKYVHYKLVKNDAEVTEKKEPPKPLAFLRSRGVNPFEIQRRVTQRGSIFEMCA